MLQLVRSAPRLENESTSRRRRLAVQVLLMALLHFAALLGVSGLVFLASHIPPKTVDLDALINLLVAVENVLVAPRKAVLWLWERTLVYLGLVLTCFNSLAWGLALTGIKMCWRKLTH